MAATSPEMGGVGGLWLKKKEILKKVSQKLSLSRAAMFVYSTFLPCAFDSDTPGDDMMEKRKVFEMALSTADAMFQNLDSSEISLTYVSHYFDSDPTNLVQNFRKDGKKPSAYIADTTTANAQWGWSATSGQVDNWVYEKANTTLIKDEEMLNKLMNMNPNSFRKLLQTFLEANGRGYWDSFEENIEKLKQLYSEVEDKIEEIDR
ncbi:hypothetical protein KY285_001543 [Solanum tuberosum]|nr:hypothetical protein KY289_001821 [Solanum tuberosum]KAH0765672.1 hypothetical protein KY285_001543 [Solanum tuberosum]